MDAENALKEQIKSQTHCPFDFDCEKACFDGYPDVQNATKLLECFREENYYCGFALYYRNAVYCRCPYLNYVRGGLYYPPVSHGFPAAT